MTVLESIKKDATGLIEDLIKETQDLIQEAYDRGMIDGVTEYKKNNDIGAAYNKGYDSGYYDGKETAEKKAEEGFKKERLEKYNQGFNAGYVDGMIGILTYLKSHNMLKEQEKE